MSTDEQFLDPVFQVPTCSRRDSGGISSGADSPECKRAIEIHRRGAALRDAAFSKHGESQRGRSAHARLSPKEISRRGDRYGSIIASPDSLIAQAVNLRRVLPVIQDSTLRDMADGPMARLHYFDRGTEAVVFIDDQDDFVYKITPIDEYVLDIPFIVDASPIYPKPKAHPLCDQFGDVTIFQRNYIYNVLPGLAKTEILAVTTTDCVITKQPFLGKDEPTMRELYQWAVKHGYGILPPQADDLELVPNSDLPVADGASSAMPLLFHHNGATYLGVDVVPRNARKMPSGDIYVFDLTARPVLNEEIDANPQIKQGVEELLRDLRYNNLKDDTATRALIAQKDVSDRRPGES